ncbi:hypothetical protein FOIG_16953 [Fusarium odoratissimum NRRL 54006]|uniref:Uncharacterized protein n=1 Tax=Fusarium odoratissimum (strain NRRL 54006) TaxID=1089451 RepID=X0ILI5_FUSO5|nr:uncharacterized protein FOIG_16953 [Fusarium odoratissimum NRRL 54006]EXL89763.1 hypothetical protein FOIG_16953 [Fusarium odoratissimum NRRL 54006]
MPGSTRSLQKRLLPSSMETTTAVTSWTVYVKNLVRLRRISCISQALFRRHLDNHFLQ